MASEQNPIPVGLYPRAEGTHFPAATLPGDFAVKIVNNPCRRGRQASVTAESISSDLAGLACYASNGAESPVPNVSKAIE